MGKCVALFILLVALSHAAKNQNRRKKTQQPAGNLVLLDETKEPMCSMDVAFLLDSSEKATPLVFEKQRALARIFAQRVMQMQTSHWRLRVRLAALQYSSTVSMETGFSDWRDLGEFHSRVGRMAYLGQGTNSAYALGNATEMFVRETEPSSLRVALLMGDGEDDPDAPSAIAMATIAKRAGVRIFTVGLTNEAREAANTATLRSIASAPAQSYVLNLNDNELQDQLLQEMTKIAEDGCPQPNFCSCEKGARGTPGSPGKKGDVGNRGPPGLKGAKGEHGRNGLQGIEGIQGKPGGRGDKGQRGERGAPGEKGAQGLDGPIGQRGVRGEQGLPGPAGDQGPSGREGPRGERGPTGITGLPGNPGVGYPGPKGDKGVVGRPGPPGPAGVGEPGLPGLPGTIGLQGISGVPGEGIPGPKGDQGLEGLMGQRGSSGVGVKGDKGNAGGKGLLGPLGFPGSGIQGGKGDQGPVGPPGPRGAPGVGLVGPKGNRGFPGEHGPPGIRGIGVPGMKGDPGQNGTAGFPGIPGEDGAVGQKGETGLPGPRGPEGAPGSGEPGEKGDRGDRGHRGLPGVVGLMGPAGAKGEPGIPGLTGLPGQMGRSLPGSKGDPGTPGPLGPAGEVGIGTIGPKGDRGLPGPVGPAGARGQGSPGAQGAPGLPGLPGEMGPEGRGFPGPKGNRGIPGALGSLGPPGIGLIGPPGPAGQMGPTGPLGQSGEGIQGPKGELGVHGMPGPRGARGEGRLGLKGSRGPDGERGRKGEAGDLGSPGLPGALGVPGEKGDPGLTKEEVMEIIREVCGCGLRCSEWPQELVFVIDGSESVGQENFNLVKNFVSALLDRIPVRRDATRVGVVQYSLVAEVTVGLQQKRWDVDAVKASVRAMRYMGEGTYTGSALARAARELQWARPGARKVLVLLTDGQTDRRDPVNLEDAAREARDDGIEVFVVGVANRRDPHFAEFVAEMNAVASDPDREHVFMIDDFGTLSALEGKLLNRICQYGDNTIFTAIAGSLLPGRGDTPTFSRTTSLDEDSLNTLTDSLVQLLPSAVPYAVPRTQPNWQYDPETTETPLTRPLPPLAQEIFIPDVRCEEPLDPGPCRKYEVMWYYDSPANSCAQFWYGGCDGNKNRFDSEASCIRACVRRI